MFLPLQWNSWNNKWAELQMGIQREHLFLVPGNSPIGLRLPLDSLPATATAKIEVEEDQRAWFG